MTDKADNSDPTTSARVTRRKLLTGTTAIAAVSALATIPTVLAQTETANAQAAATTDKPPNFLIIWGDDIGTWNISHNSKGMMGYETPNIDRIAREGVAFTD